MSKLPVRHWLRQCDNGDTMAGMMLQAGTVAYVTKNSPADDVLTAVRAAR